MNSYELVLNNSSPYIAKKLYFYPSLEFLNNRLSDNVLFCKIYNGLWAYITHYGEDYSKHSKKIYISLYNRTFSQSLKLISLIKKILQIDVSYKLENNFVWFDCIGIDFFEDWTTDLKIYEIIKDKNISLLPSYLDKHNIKEVGYLKSFSGRKKKFFRFLNLEHIHKFYHDFDLSLQPDWWVKYLCVEWKKMEIYFIHNNENTWSLHHEHL